MTSLLNITEPSTTSLFNVTGSTDHLPDFDVARSIHFVLLGIVIPFGLIFNTLSFVVLASSHRLRRSTTGHYLLALAVADNLYLLGDLIKWINSPMVEHLNVHVDFLDRYDAICKLTHYVRHGARLASAWITVAITTERCIAVTAPMKVAQLSTKRLAKISILVVFGASFLANIYLFWSTGQMISSNKSRCQITNNKTFQIGNWVFHRVGSLFVPAVLLLVLTSIIIYNLNKAQRFRLQQQSSQRSNSTQGASPASLQRQLGWTLVAVAVTFLVLRLLGAVGYYLNNYKWDLFPERTETDIWFRFRLYLLYKITDSFVCLNYAINFFLYCICSRTFRGELYTVCSSSSRRRTSESRLSVTQTTCMNESRFSRIKNYIRLTSLNNTKNGSNVRSNLRTNDQVKDARKIPLQEPFEEDAADKL